MTNLLALLPDPVMRARIQAASKVHRPDAGVHQLCFADDWADAFRIARTSPPNILVFDPYASGELNADACASWAAAFPTTALFAYGDFDRSAAQDILRLASAGVRGVAARDVDDTPATLLALLEELPIDRVANDVVAVLGNRLTPETEALIRYLIQNVRLPLTPGTAARFYHRDTKTLREHLKKEGLPSIGKLIVWLRLLCAAHLLQDSACSVESVALSLGFSSVNSFRNQLRRSLGVCPTELRTRGGFEVVLNELSRRCNRPARGATAEPGRRGPTRLRRGSLP